MKRSLSKFTLSTFSVAAATVLSTQLAFATDTPAEQHFLKGMSENSSGQYAEAVADYSKAIELNPQYWKAYGNRSAARYNVNDYKGALSDVNIAIAHLPGIKALDDIKVKCETAIAAQANAPSAEAVARARIAQQMLLNATIGGNDISSPAFQIMMAARRAQGLDPFTGMRVSNAAVPARTFSSMDATNSQSVNAKLEALEHGAHSSAPAHTKSDSTSSAFAGNQSAEPIPDANTTQGRLAMQAANLKFPPVSTSMSNSSTSSTNSSASSSMPSSSSSVMAPSASPDISNSEASPPRPTGLSSVNYARNPKTNMTAQDYFDRGCGKGKAMDLAGALKDYDEAIKLNPNHGPAYANRGSTRFNLGSPKGALDDFNTAVQMMPDNLPLKELRDKVAKSVGQ